MHNSTNVYQGYNHHGMYAAAFDPFAPPIDSTPYEPVDFFAPTNSNTILDNVFIYSRQHGLICRGVQCDDTTNNNAYQIYQTITKVHQFFKEVFGLDGIDGNGSIPPIYIDWDEKNAAWSCSTYFGNKQCAWIFNNEYVFQPDVVAHEYMHAVISSFTSLNHEKQSGSLHESLADVFGIAFKHWLTGDTNDWTIANRDLASHPLYFHTSIEPPSNLNDCGFVHANSVIPSHAFYHAVTKMKLVSWSVVAEVWFRAMQRMVPHDNFNSFALKTIVEANNFSSDPNHAKANAIFAKTLILSWAAVGINPLHARITRV